MKKILNAMCRLERIVEDVFVAIVAAGLVMVLAMTAGCQLCCNEHAGTLKLRNDAGEYVAVCRGQYFESKRTSVFRCDDGRKIMRPVNFIIER